MVEVDIGKLKLKILGFAYPGATNPHDADWLNVSISYQSPFAQINFGGIYLAAGELKQFQFDIQKMYTNMTKRAVLEPMEPNVTIKISSIGRLGAMRAEIQLIPELSGAESHFFEFEMDQSYLPGIISSLKSIALSNFEKESRDGSE